MRDHLELQGITSMWISLFCGSCRTIRLPHVTIECFLSTGMIVGDKINCHLAKEIGVASIKSVIGGDLGQVKFKTYS